MDLLGKNFYTRNFENGQWKFQMDLKNTFPKSQLDAYQLFFIVMGSRSLTIEMTKKGSFLSGKRDRTAVVVYCQGK